MQRLDPLIGLPRLNLVQWSQKETAMEAKSGQSQEGAVLEPGTGLCPEAQADGVPCTALGKDCEICEKAYPKKEGKPRE